MAHAKIDGGLFLDLAEIQNFPCELLDQIDELMLDPDYVDPAGGDHYAYFQLEAGDLAANGGGFRLNIWDARELPSGWQIQIGLSCLLDAHGSALRKGEEKPEGAKGLNLKMERFVIPHEQLSESEILALESLAAQHAQGLAARQIRQPYIVSKSEDFLMQFWPKILNVKVGVGDDQSKADRIFGSGPDIGQGIHLSEFVIMGAQRAGITSPAPRRVSATSGNAELLARFSSREPQQPQEALTAVGEEFLEGL